MKTRLASILVLAAALGAVFSVSLNAAPTSASAQARAITLRMVNNHGWEVSRGTPKQTLLNRFGAPDTKLSDNVWVYRRFHAVPNHPEARECTTLVVTLADGLIANLHLVNERAQAIIAARVQSGSPAIVATAE